ncbi:unnamed protein product, partial [Tuber aestivum]
TSFSEPAATAVPHLAASNPHPSSPLFLRPPSFLAAPPARPIYDEDALSARRDSKDRDNDPDQFFHPLLLSTDKPIQKWRATRLLCPRRCSRRPLSYSILPIRTLSCRVLSSAYTSGMPTATSHAGSLSFVGRMCCYLGRLTWIEKTTYPSVAPPLKRYSLRRGL